MQRHHLITIVELLFTPILGSDQAAADARAPANTVEGIGTTVTSDRTPQTQNHQSLERVLDSSHSCPTPLAVLDASGTAFGFECVKVHGAGQSGADCAQLPRHHSGGTHVLTG